MSGQPHLISALLKMFYTEPMTQDVFRYQTFDLSDDRHTATFSYRLEHAGQSYDFTEVIEFPVALASGPEQQACLRALHIALGVSYYKIFVPQRIEHPYEMSAAEADFWNDVWQHGLGEFLYVNKLSATDLAQFAAQPGENLGAGQTRQVEAPQSLASTALLGIGGGKDSIVARELLGKIGVAVQGFVMATGEQLGQAQAVAQVMDVPLHVIKRTLDKQLLSVQEQPGAFKGHIPISLIFGLVGATLAIATGSAYVVVANESSASIPRGNGGRMAVNHQWSKSFGFEQSLQKYLHDMVNPQLTYFSAVRQLTSVGVAKLFARLPQYFEVFTSDNFVFRIDPSKRPNGRWSLESPKSLSSFILLSAWISEPDMLRIFGRNFLDEASLEPLFLALLGVRGDPPLDCVGTVEELVLSLNLAVRQGKFAGSALLELAREHQVLSGQDWDAELAQMLTVQTDSALPTALVEPITTAITEELQS